MRQRTAEHNPDLPSRRGQLQMANPRERQQPPLARAPLTPGPPTHDCPTPLQIAPQYQEGLWGVKRLNAADARACALSVQNRVTSVLTAQIARSSAAPHLPLKKER